MMYRCPFVFIDGLKIIQNLAVELYILGLPTNFAPVCQSTDLAMGNF